MKNDKPFQNIDKQIKILKAMRRRNRNKPDLEKVVAKLEKRIHKLERIVLK
jgi:hypothetical protein